MYASKHHLLDTLNLARVHLGKAEALLSQIFQ
jgi:hypothetical protein